MVVFPAGQGTGRTNPCDRLEFAAFDALTRCVKPKSSRSPEIPAWALELARAVRRKRKLLRLTQKELADLSGCGADFLYDLERGKPTIRLDKLMPVLDMLGFRFALEPKKK